MSFDINDNDHKSVDDATDDDSDNSNDNNNDFLDKESGNTFHGKRGFSMKSFWYVFDKNDHDHKGV